MFRWVSWHRFRTSRTLCASTWVDSWQTPSDSTTSSAHSTPGGLLWLSVSIPIICVIWNCEIQLCKTRFTSTEMTIVFSALGTQAVFLVMSGYCKCGQEMMAVVFLTIGMGISGFQVSRNKKVIYFVSAICNYVLKLLIPSLSLTLHEY